MERGTTRAARLKLNNPDRQRHNAGENDAITHIPPQTFERRPSLGPVDCTVHEIRSYLWLRSINSSPIATILSRVYRRDTLMAAVPAHTFQQIAFSANLATGKNLPHSHQSFSFSLWCRWRCGRVR